MLKKVLTGLVIFLLVSVAVLTGLTWKLAIDSQKMTVAAGHQDALLLPCPATPNCVSSQAAESDSHYIAPINNSENDKWSKLTETLDSVDEARREVLESNYAYYTFKTPLMGFIDDVEFLHVPEQGVIHVRSASRVGRSDMNANRNRIEKIRGLLEMSQGI